MSRDPVVLPEPILRALPRNLTWNTVCLLNGETVQGAIAGPVVQVNTHYERGADRCCARWVSKGQLPCLLCDKFCALTCRGYQPIFTAQREKVVVLLSETVIPRVKHLEIGRGVRFTRPKKGKRPVAVVPLDPFDVGDQCVKETKAMGSQFVFEYLCHVWQKREITEHFGFTYHRAVRPQEDMPNIDLPAVA